MKNRINLDICDLSRHELQNYVGDMFVEHGLVEEVLEISRALDKVILKEQLKKYPISY